MKGYLVDPFERTVTEVEVPYREKGLQAFYELLQCETFDVARIHENGDVLYVDDDGLFKPGNQFFLAADYPQPLCGRALLLGTDTDGETIPPKLGMDWLRENIKFLDRNTLALVGRMKRPAYGLAVVPWGTRV